MFDASNYTNHARRATDTPERLAQALAFTRAGLSANQKRIPTTASAKAPAKAPPAARKPLTASALALMVAKDDRVKLAIAGVVQAAIARRRDLVSGVATRRTVH